MGMREIVLYVPSGGYSSTADIARGSAIVGELQAGAAEVEVYFEGAIFGQENMRTLADRATHAAGRMLERYATTAARIVPRDALLAVGTFDFREGRIRLTGSDSERAVATWLGTPQLTPRSWCRARQNGAQRPTRWPSRTCPSRSLARWVRR
jgi:hypothetical protein